MGANPLDHRFNPSKPEMKVQLQQQAAPNLGKPVSIGPFQNKHVKKTLHLVEEVPLLTDEPGEKDEKPEVSITPIPEDQAEKIAGLETQNRALLRLVGLLQAEVEARKK